YSPLEIILVGTGERSGSATSARAHLATCSTSSRPWSSSQTRPDSVHSSTGMCHLRYGVPSRTTAPSEPGDPRDDRPRRPPRPAQASADAPGPDGLDDPVVDRVPGPAGRVEFEDPQPEVGGQPDMLRLADVEPLAFRVQSQLADRPDGRQ